jgi:hypothetical protein
MVRSGRARRILTAPMVRRLEKYELLEEIGHGGMATVFRARDAVLDRPVAVKILHPHLRAAPEARARFQREAQSVARLRHPRVMEIYDFSGEGSEEAYLVAELLTGPTLKAFREAQERMPAEIAACFAHSIGEALQAAHEAQIIHRDVKPENVLLHEAREVKLTDFGIADMVDAHSMTATGQILGSPGHMAPEQIEGKDADGRTDEFSLGTVLYYLATGRLPFAGRNPHQILKRIVDGDYVDPLRVEPAVGGRLAAIIARSLETNPDDRYPTVGAMIADLEGFLAEAGIDDPHAALAAYLKDPDGESARLRASTVPRLVEAGQRASDAGDVPRALDYYNRVLALEPGHPEVLKLVRRVGMDRRRRTMAAFGLGLSALGVLSASAAIAVWPEGGGREPPVDPRTFIVAGPRDAAPADAPRDADAPRGDAGSADAGATDAGPGAGDAGRRRPVVLRPAVEREPVPVILITDPTVVAVSVDGGPFRESTQRLSMTPGRHRLLLRPTSANTPRGERRLTLVVPSGVPEFRSELLALPYREAVLIVDGPLDGEVQVEDVRGALGEYLHLTMDADERLVTVRIVPEGGSPVVETARIHAGRIARLTVGR